MSVYTDLKSNEHKLIQQVKPNKGDREELKRTIIEELYNILSKVKNR